MAEAEAADAVAEVLGRWGQGVAIEPSVASSSDGESVEVDPSRPVLLKTYLPLDERAGDLRRELEQAVWHLGRLGRVEPLQVRLLAERDWAHAWKRHFFVQPVGQRLVIVPSWRRYRQRPGQLVVRLDPGMAFGTGLHPTTRLCLQALECWLRPGARVLDLGTGSGILAIAAARLGAEAVRGLDIDPIAVRAARANVRRNRADGRVVVELGSLPLREPALVPYDLAVANISVRVLVELLGQMRAALAPTGVAILSGVLAEAQDALLTAVVGQGLQELETQREGDWICLVARRGA